MGAGSSGEGLRGHGWATGVHAPLLGPARGLPCPFTQLPYPASVSPGTLMATRQAGSPPQLTPRSLRPWLCPAHLWKLSFLPGHPAAATSSRPGGRGGGRLLNSSLPPVARPQPRGPEQQTFISHSSGGWKIQDQGWQLGCLLGAASWLAGGHPPTVSSQGRERELWGLFPSLEGHLFLWGQSLTLTASLRALCPIQSCGGLGLRPT